MSLSTNLLFVLDTTLRAGAWTPASYEVLFTNPVCPQQKIVAYRPRNPPPQTYMTAEGPVKISPDRDDVPAVPVESDGIPTLGGGRRRTIPANIYCDQNDFEASTLRAADNPYRKTDSPIHRIQDWIQSTTRGDELFIASFSFSMASVANWTCDAARRGVRVKVFMHEPEFGSDAFETIRQCPGIELLQFQNKGRLAHFKSIVIVSKDTDQVRISFQSGNISSGTWGHHENWNFVTQSRQHWFSQDHICLRDAINAETIGNMGLLYEQLDQCRTDHGVDVARAQDPYMQDYFIPKTGGRYDDRKELDKIVGEVEHASEVWIAAHHMTEPDLIRALIRKLQNNPDFKVKMLIDSELFWSSYRDPVGQGLTWKVDGKVFGESDSLTSYCLWGLTEAQARDVQCSLFNWGAFHAEYSPHALQKAGADLRFIESNHLSKLLFHNKFIIFQYASPENGMEGSVFTGAGNLTKAGFDKNFENYYWVRIPHVYEAFRQQFTMLFDKAAMEKDLPITWDFRTVDDGLKAYP
ncbi:MAG TPA: phospholipase D-like domain-containing protein [Oligoflexus sp.]|uniref:phospholipase D-like domain-containing protein n=1 Tax=Oligoflexus sp. TaxID=1971216 RepID=UPI002D445D03|nr:phospholipase D-like domain-containing protein [Oligoflexus sp.]HYX38809.1 phospholipase D-like domain-containing protein [Oligoflexus sp.]